MSKTFKNNAQPLSFNIYKEVNIQNLGVGWETRLELGHVVRGPALAVSAGGAVMATPASIRLPHLVENLHYFLIDDEDYGHIHTHTA